MGSIHLNFQHLSLLRSCKNKSAAFLLSFSGTRSRTHSLIFCHPIFVCFGGPRSCFRVLKLHIPGLFTIVSSIHLNEKLLNICMKMPLQIKFDPWKNEYVKQRFSIFVEIQDILMGAARKIFCNSALF